MCLVYNRTQKFFDKRATLYHKALDILLEEWAADKRLEMGDIYEGLNTELEKVLLAEIAYNGFVNDQLFFTRQELIDQINHFIEDTADKPTLPGKDILDAIAEQQGIFVERAEDVYSFSHLTLQEYLTAQYISQDSQLVIDVVNAHLLEDRWREVFLLIPGLLRKADAYLLDMQSVAQRCLSTPKLKELIDWANGATKGSESNYKPVAKRVAAIFIARDLSITLARDIDLELAIVRARDITNARDLARDLSIVITRDLSSISASASASASGSASGFGQGFSFSAIDFALDFALTLAFDLAREFKRLNVFEKIDFSTIIMHFEAFKEQTESNHTLFNNRRELLERINEIWCQALTLNPDLLKLSDHEVENLTYYLSANRLILECKGSAIRVSKNTWDMIENRMLTLWEE